MRGRALRADPLVTRPQRQIDFRRTVTVVAPTLAGRVLHADPAEAGRIENICGGPSCRWQTAPRRQVERCTPTQDVMNVLPGPLSPWPSVAQRVLASGR